MPFVVKAALNGELGSDPISFDEKTMYGGKNVGSGDEIFLFASENQGGQGLCAKAVVMSAVRGPGIRVRIEVRPTAMARRRLGRSELKQFRDRLDNRPETEIARKLYRQATNKIASISDEAAALLATYF